MPSEPMSGCLHLIDFRAIALIRVTQHCSENPPLISLLCISLTQRRTFQPASSCPATYRYLALFVLLFPWRTLPFRIFQWPLLSRPVVTGLPFVQSFVGFHRCWAQLTYKFTASFRDNIREQALSNSIT